jgi:hypothetical protein
MIKIKTKLVQVLPFKQIEVNKIIEKELANTLARIDRLLMAGLNPDSKKLKEYSKAYKKRILAGKVRGKANTTVNLTQTGTLRRSRQIQSLPNGAQIDFIGGHGSNLSANELASIQLKTRNFHFLGKADIERLRKSFQSLSNLKFTIKNP